MKKSVIITYNELLRLICSLEAFSISKPGGIKTVQVESPSPFCFSSSWEPLGSGLTSLPSPPGFLPSSLGFPPVRAAFFNFQKLPDPALIKFSFLLSTFVRATELNTPNNTQGVSILCKTSNKLYTVLFLKERDKVVIKQKQNLGIVSLA